MKEHILIFFGLRAISKTIIRTNSAIIDLNKTIPIWFSKIKSPVQ